MFPCPGCKQPTNLGAQFCPNCGYPLKKPQSGKLLTGYPWLDGFLGFLLYWAVTVASITMSSMEPTLGGSVGLALWIGTPLVLGLGMRYRAMALGYLIGLGVVVALILGLLLVCGVMIGSGSFH